MATIAKRRGKTRRKVDPRAVIMGENRLDIDYRVIGDEAKALNIKAARTAIQDAVKKIPNQALKGLKSFRVTIIA